MKFLSPVIALIGACAAGILSAQTTLESVPENLSDPKINAAQIDQRPVLPMSSTITLASTSAQISTELFETALAGNSALTVKKPPAVLGATTSGELETTPATPSPSPVVKTQSTITTPTTKSEPLPPSYWDAAFEQYGNQYSVDPELLKYIAKCESTFRQEAVNGPYGGMYQYLASTWSATRTAMGEDPNPDLRFNGEEAIKTTAWKIAHGGIRAWPSCSKRAVAALSTQS